MKTNDPQKSVLLSIFQHLVDSLSGNAKQYRMPLGAVLLKEKLIDSEQLDRALKKQDESEKNLGSTPPLGQIMVAMGYFSEVELIKAINKHYKLSVNSLSADIESYITNKRRTFLERFLQVRIPIWFQLSVATTLIILFAIFALSFIILNRQKNELYAQTVKVGTVSLNFFTNDAKIPLLEDNALRLNTLIKEATSVEGIRYAFIVDTENIILAHTDHNLINTPFTEVDNPVNLTTEGEITHFTYISPDNGEHLLNLIRPVQFQSTRLGEVHVGISLDFIDQAIEQAKWSIIGMTTLIILLGIGTTVYLGFRFSNPILKLVLATKRIGSGQYDHRVDLSNRLDDELKDLGEAFNKMSHDLWLKSIMQESFGKYVGAEVLDMIMANPESTWVKGHRNNATALFTDVRNFTAYSREREPEEVVEALNEYFEIATAAISAQGGYIDKFIGDAVLGVYGVPVYYEDHIERAVRTAVDMQKKLAEAGKNGNQLLSAVGIGIHSGMVVAGNIGSTSKMEYTVIGDTVNVASRINSLARAGEIIISKWAYEKISHLVEAEELEPQMIKGHTKPVEILRIIRLKEQNNDNSAT